VDYGYHDPKQHGQWATSLEYPTYLVHAVIIIEISARLFSDDPIPEQSGVQTAGYRDAGFHQGREDVRAHREVLLARRLTPGCQDAILKHNCAVKIGNHEAHLPEAL
jgi:hypothetical protein